MKKEMLYILAGALLVSCAYCSPSLKFNYNLNHLGGQRWQYNYSIENVNFLPDVAGFKVFFEYGLYSNLTSQTPLPLKTNWDEFISQPEHLSPFDPFDGFYDSLAISEPLSPGQSVSGLSVSFDWLGEGEPGEQSFEIYDPVTWETIASDKTKFNQVGVIPAPGAFCLAALGSVLVAAFKKN